MPDKYGSNRYGWNQRGPTVKDQIRSAKDQSEMLNPDSDYWKNRTYQTRDLLVSCMGEREFDEWAERVFPGDSIDWSTWKQIHDLYDEKFQRVQAEIAMVDGHDWEDDPRHYKTNGVF